MLLKFKLDKDGFTFTNLADLIAAESIDYIKCHFDITDTVWEETDAIIAVFKSATYNKHSEVLLDSYNNCYIDPEVYKRGGRIQVKLVGDKYLNDTVISSTTITSVLEFNINDNIIVPLESPSKYSIAIAELEKAKSSVDEVLTDLAYKLAHGELNGVGIDHIVYNLDGTVTITLSDGTVFTSEYSMKGATGNSGVYYGPDEPTDPDIFVWVNPDGEPTFDPLYEIIDTWLQAHPEATTTVQDGAITEAKLSAALKLKVLKDYVTPEMYGAVGDGITDDTTAVSDAFNSGKIVICNNTYLISGITINGPVNIFGGKFVCDNSNPAYLINVKSDNVRISDASFDCSNNANGIGVNMGLTTICSNVIISNCKIINCNGGSVSSLGIAVNRSYGVVIDKCEVSHVVNNNSKATRGIYFNRSNFCTIKNCTVYEIHSGDDADGIHIIYDGASDESNYSMLIDNCDVYECDKRYIKVQQKNVTVSNCSFLLEKSTTAASVASISVYDDNCTIIGCFIHGRSPIQVQLSGASSDDPMLYNFKMLNCVLQDYYNSMQGLVQTSESSARTFDGLTFIGNRFVCDYTTYGICIRNVSGERIVIANNYFIGGSANINFKYDNSIMTIKDVIICNNYFKADYPINFTHNGTKIVINGFSATDNIWNALTQYQDYNALIRGTLDNFDQSKLNVYGNIPSADSTAGYYGYRELVATRGATARRPAVGINGLSFYDTTTHKTWTYQDGTWYLPDGTSA